MTTAMEATRGLGFFMPLVLVILWCAYQAAKRAINWLERQTKENPR